MNPERLRDIEQLYHAAREDRAALANSDPELRREVESLLARDSSSGPLDQAALEVAADLFGTTITLLGSGSQLGPYRIEEPIGAGGMGQVFRAKDTRLNRTVALKVMLSRLAANEASRRRFQFEARSIAGLSHPHICPLFDVGEQEGTEFLVMEYLVGQTLSERLRNGPLPLDEVLLYAAQILSALDHAHRKGILHRDLKPANIMLSGSGSGRSVKLLDFGLAKALEPEHPNVDGGHDESAEIAITAPGMIAGTPHYLAPEVLLGRPATARSDLHAFGAIVYEMLAGRKAFEGNNKAQVLAAVTRDEPTPLATLRPELPAALGIIVKRCLAKNPEERWQSAADLLAALQLTGGRVEAIAPVARPRKTWLLAGSLAAVAALAIAGGLLLWLRGRGTNSSAPVRFFLSPPDNEAFVAGSGVPSPDGRSIAFVARSASGQDALWLRSLDSLNAQRISGTEGASGPFWSPEARFLGFFAQGKLKKVDLASGAVQNLCNAATDLGATWNRSGDIIVAPHNRTTLHRLSASGGEPQPITTLDTARGENSHRWPRFLPDGRHFIFTARSAVKENTIVYAGSLDSKQIRPILRAQSNAAYAAPGYLLFAREGTLLAQHFDAAKLELAGEPFSLVASVDHATASARAQFAVSGDGSVLVHQQSKHTSRMIWFNRGGLQLRSIGPEGDFTQPRISPDEKRIALASPDKNSGYRDIWLMDAASGGLTRFTSHPANDWFPVWSPDGARIAFSSDRIGQGSLFQKALNGEEEELLVQPGVRGSPTDWSADGRFLLYHVTAVQGSLDIWALPLFAERKPFPLLATEFRERDSRISPDGNWVAYVSNESGNDEIYVKPFARSGKQRISTAGGHHPVWRHDGRELLFGSDDGSMMSVELKAGEAFEASPPRPLFHVCNGSQTFRSATYNYDVSADGKRFLMACQLADSKPSPFTVELHWSAGLK